MRFFSRSWGLTKIAGEGGALIDSFKEAMLATIRGQATASIPWVPRLDLWFNAQRQAGTLPAKYRRASLMEMTDDLGWGFHAVIPDFRDLQHSDDDLHRGLGVWNLGTMPCRTLFEDVDVLVERSGDRTTVEYHTPVGVVRTSTVYNQSMRDAGITISHVSETAIKGCEDYDAVGYLFEHARVVPNYQGFNRYMEAVGERGLTVARISGAASPMHLLHKELMSPILLFYEMYDHPDELSRCAERIGAYFERLFEVALASPAQVLHLGGNYDAAMLPPPFFAKYLTPWLRRFAERAHAQAKFLLCHTDGENEGNLDEYLMSGMDIADSVCPAPMTSLTLRQIRDAFAGKVTIMGGIPSVALLRDSMGDREFESFLDKFFGELGAGDHIILGVSDTTPPAAEFDRLVAVHERVKAFGPVRSTAESSA